MMNGKYWVNEFFLLIAGAAAGALFSLLLETDIRWIFVIIAGAIFLIFTGMGFSWFLKGFSSIKKAIRKKRIGIIRIVGILNDIEWDSDLEKFSTWTNVTPSEWMKKIKLLNEGENRKKPRLKSKQIKLQSNLDSYNFVLNPYGGVYPEDDTIKLYNQSKIFEYVASGGIFINIADIPGYWMYHTKLKTKIDATPLVWVSHIDENTNISPSRFFLNTPFMEKLAIRIYGIPPNTSLNWDECFPGNIFTPEEIKSLDIERFAIIEKNIKPIIKTRFPNIQEEITSMFYVPYGNGKFLFCLYFMNRPQNSIIPEKLIKLMKILDL